MTTDEAQEALKDQTRDELDALREEYEAKQKPQELRELSEALLDVSREVKTVVAPLLKFEFAQRLLYQLLKECRKDGRDFSAAIEDLLPALAKISNEVKADPSKGLTANDHFWRIAQPQEEKEPQVDQQTLCDLLNNAAIYLDRGRRKFKQHNYEGAYENFKIGADALAVKAEGHIQDGLTIKLLSNQALAALKTDRWAACVKCCDQILTKRNDFKAHYRRGLAMWKRGDIDEARASLKRVLDFENETYDFRLNDAKQLARKHLADIDKGVKKDKEFATQMAQHFGKLNVQPSSIPQEQTKGSLSLDAALKLQAAVLKQGPKQGATMQDRYEAAYLPHLPSVGFPPTRDGLRALEREMTIHMADPRVRANAHKLILLD